MRRWRLARDRNSANSAPPPSNSIELILIVTTGPRTPATTAARTHAEYLFVTIIYLYNVICNILSFGAASVTPGDRPQAVGALDSQAEYQGQRLVSHIACSLADLALQKPSNPVSGTESDSDSVFSPEVMSPPTHPSTALFTTGGLPHPPLQSIAERRTGSGEESEEDEEDEEGGWHVETREQELARGSHDETVLKTGYLWKKGERRKVRHNSPFSSCILTVCTDLEEALVRPPHRASCLLQNVSRVQASPPARPLRDSLLHARPAQEAYKHILYDFAHSNILPAGRVTAVGHRMGQGDYGCAANSVGNVDPKHRNDRPNTHPPLCVSGTPFASSFAYNVSLAFAVQSPPNVF